MELGLKELLCGEGSMDGTKVTTQKSAAVIHARGSRWWSVSSCHV